MKNTTEMKNILEGINSKSDIAEDRINDWEDKVAEIHSEQWKGKRI